MRNNSLATIAGLVIACCLGIAAQTQAAPLRPRIDSVLITGSPGNYTATLSGANFGAAPDGIPCDACAPEQLQLVILQSQPHRQSINITDWSDTSITITGIPAARDDALRIAVYNQLLGSVSARGGDVGKRKGRPRIMHVHAVGSGKTLSLTIEGSGFGDAPPQVGQNTNSPYFVFSDFNAQAPFTEGFPWNAGFCGAPDCNGVTMGYVSWTDTQIVMSGFGDQYGNNYLANPGDAFCVGVWPSTSQSNGTTGGSTKCRHIPK
ncbi:MAG: hypothetical protein JO056_11040 [Alphaproteobacteria bacterium]|nr:hypothetical protein [Alphaproteobacteria bacterium]